MNDEPNSRRRSVAIVALLAATLLAGPAVAQTAAVPKLQEDVQVLVDQLEARAIDCPAKLLDPDTVDRIYCAALDLEFKHLRKAVSKFIRKNQDLLATQLGAWRTTDSELRTTSLLVGDLVLRMVFDPRSSTLFLIPHAGCLENSAVLAPGVFDWASDGVESPRTGNIPQAEVPAESPDGESLGHGGPSGDLAERRSGR